MNQVLEDNHLWKIWFQKISDLREKIDKKEKNIHIQVDGGINTKTISKTTKAGANMIVAGSSVFGAKRRNKKSNN